MGLTQKEYEREINKLQNEYVIPADKLKKLNEADCSHIETVGFKFKNKQPFICETLAYEKIKANTLVIICKVCGVINKLRHTINQ